MYAMPGEVLKADRPGFLMFSLTQLLAGVGAFFVAPSLGFKGPAIFIVVVLVVLLVRRVRGLYLAEQAGYWLRALARSIFNEGQSSRLDPLRLYQIQAAPVESAAYLVKTPDGQIMTVKG
jgi:hypothetical protein